MTLSICIPVYNFDVNALIKDIRNQIVADNLDAEIIVIDDASRKDIIEKNSGIRDIADEYILLKQNIGRSRIRNLFLEYAESEYLLFLDCDGKIIADDFIKKYADFIRMKNPDVVYGGRKVEESRPDPEFGLRWKFAVERENLPVEVRKRSPYLDFQTNNFIVRKTVLQSHPFDETISQYGYEDLIFAKDLYKSKIKIEHIDNPVFNNDVEPNAVFLRKADQSAKSLAHLINTDRDIQRSSKIKLARAYFLLKKTGGVFLYDFFYKLLKPLIVRKLIRGNASLKILDLYKLGQLIGYMNKN
jgi:glycosyltransferase involved in cell wall biosynthesis